MNDCVRAVLVICLPLLLLLARVGSFDAGLPGEEKRSVWQQFMNPWRMEPLTVYIYNKGKGVQFSCQPGVWEKESHCCISAKFETRYGKEASSEKGTMRIKHFGGTGLDLECVHNKVVKGAYNIRVYYDPIVKIDPVKVVMHLPNMKVKGQAATCMTMNSPKLVFDFVEELEKKIKEEVCLKLGFVDGKCILMVAYKGCRMKDKVDVYLEYHISIAYSYRYQEKRCGGSSNGWQTEAELACHVAEVDFIISYALSAVKAMSSFSHTFIEQNVKVSGMLSDLNFLGKLEVVRKCRRNAVLRWGVCVVCRSDEIFSRGHCRQCPPRFKKNNPSKCKLRKRYTHKVPPLAPVGMEIGCMKNVFTSMGTIINSSLALADQHPAGCVGKCLQIGQPIAILSSAGCFCGSVEDATPLLVEQRECNMACLAVPQEDCGSKQRANAYHTGLGGFVGGEYQGCFEKWRYDTIPFAHHFPHAPKTWAGCIRYAREKNHTFAGMQGDNCYGDSQSLILKQLVQQRCYGDHLCRGKDKTRHCGTNSEVVTWSAYRTGLDGDRVCSYVGCFKDSDRRIMPGYKFWRNDGGISSPSDCRDHCRYLIGDTKTGDKPAEPPMFGLELAKECYCGWGYYLNPGRQMHPRDCLYYQTRDKKPGGGDWMLAVYSNRGYGWLGGEALMCMKEGFYEKADITEGHTFYNCFHHCNNKKRDLMVYTLSKKFCSCSKKIGQELGSYLANNYMCNGDTKGFVRAYNTYLINRQDYTIT